MNDTAQIDFFKAEAREKVILKILSTAKYFDIINFDSASALTQRCFKNLWFSEAGKNDSEHGYSEPAKEFWREVIERFEKESPETLLCAEVSFETSRFFVRYLGMHRVVNLLFAEMLKNEENKKYKQVLKTILEYDPGILKRLVNVMNVSDKQSFADQFGMENKYFGIFTMMCTLPGLPMLEHSQITENEKTEDGQASMTSMFERLEKEIFSLLRNRNLFSGTGNFCLYDFFSGGELNDNVFVWSNVSGKDKAFIFYNNSSNIALGRANTTVPFSVKNNEGAVELKRKSFTEALQLSTAPRMYTIFQEMYSGLFFIRSNEELEEQGLFVVLNGYEIQMFTNIREVENTDGFYSIICENLNGRGCASIEQELLDLKYSHLYKALEDFADKRYFGGINGLVTDKENKNNAVLDKNFDEFFSDIEERAKVFFDVMMKAELKNTYNNARVEEYEKYDDEVNIILNNLRLRLKNVIKARFLILPESGKEHSGEKHVVLKTIDKDDASVIIAYGAILFGLMDIDNTISKRHSKLKTETLIDFFGLNKKFAKNIYGICLSFKRILYILDIFKILVERNKGNKFEDEQAPEEFVKKLFTDKDVREIINTHDKDIVNLFNQETAEIVIFITVSIYFFEFMENGKTLEENVQNCVDLYIKLSSACARLEE